jgi:hypothetical protein
MLDDAATVGVMISCITPHAIASWYLAWRPAQGIMKRNVKKK